ncbi:hypothetical protein IE53DRAFT_236835 [Violaceomyces palustris]|uniref:Uncharacterized protein n=1 Tax=Violaceomyces palustris TaxID=1673888 RepID=A0ACD0P4F7_9BASI|nr:hypothetical protein IE53DRAFT_236835 [Violaceomyces palustris]
MSQDTSGTTSSNPAPAPTRNERKACWDHRDRYYDCLTKNEIAIPPGTDMSDGRGPFGKAAAEEQARKQTKFEDDLRNDPCVDLRVEYERNCAKSWIDYFNKRRVLEQRQKLMYAQGSEAGDASKGANFKR